MRISDWSSDVCSSDLAKVANLSSELGSITDAGRFGTPSYCISKAAQNMASVLLAHALRERGIVVAALHPGWVQTDMGGPNATVPAADSVSGLTAVTDGLARAANGRFRDLRGGTLRRVGAGDQDER